MARANKPADAAATRAQWSLPRWGRPTIVPETAYGGTLRMRKTRRTGTANAGIGTMNAGIDCRRLVASRWLRFTEESASGADSREMPP